MTVISGDITEGSGEIRAINRAWWCKHHAVARETSLDGAVFVHLFTQAQTTVFWHRAEPERTVDCLFALTRCCANISIWWQWACNVCVGKAYLSFYCVEHEMKQRWCQTSLLLERRKLGLLCLVFRAAKNTVQLVSHTQPVTRGLTYLAAQLDSGNEPGTRNSGITWFHQYASLCLCPDQCPVRCYWPLWFRCVGRHGETTVCLKQQQEFDATEAPVAPAVKSISSMQEEKRMEAKALLKEIKVFLQFWPCWKPSSQICWNDIHVWSEVVPSITRTSPTTVLLSFHVLKQYRALVSGLRHVASASVFQHNIMAFIQNKVVKVHL